MQRKLLPLHLAAIIAMTTPATSQPSQCKSELTLNRPHFTFGMHLAAAESYDCDTPRLIELRKKHEHYQNEVGDYWAAESVGRKRVKLLEKECGPEHLATVTGMFEHGYSMHAARNYDKAASLIERAENIWINDLALDPAQILSVYYLLADSHYREGRANIAESSARAALASHASENEVDLFHIAMIKLLLANILLSRGSLGEAEQLYKESLVTLEKKMYVTLFVNRDAYVGLHCLFIKQNRTEEAEATLKKYERLITTQYLGEKMHLMMLKKTKQTMQISAVWKDQSGMTNVLQ